VIWLSVAYVYGYHASYRLITPLEMGTDSITVWSHCNLIVKLIRGMESGTILKELVFVFDLKN
jgi:hypothetical protein